MNILIGALFVAGGIGFILYKFNKTNKLVTEVKYMKTSTISELKEMLNNMSDTGVGDTYRHYVELKGIVDSEDEIVAPYSNNKVAYYKSKLYHVYQYETTKIDSNGNTSRNIQKKETIINEDNSNSYIVLKDENGDKAYIDVNSIDDKIQAEKTFEKFEPSNRIQNYRINLGNFNLNLDKGNSKTLGYKMVEETVQIGKPCYALGNAKLDGDKIIIERSEDKETIFAPKTEEAMLRDVNKSRYGAIFAGVIFALIGLFIMFR